MSTVHANCLFSCMISLRVLLLGIRSRGASCACRRHEIGVGWHGQGNMICHWVPSPSSLFRVQAILPYHHACQYAWAGMGRPGPSLEPGPMTSSLILGVMGLPISPRCYSLDGPLGIMGRPKYFSIILNHEYYQHF